MRTVENIDNIVKFFHNDEEFIEYAKLIYKENEDEDFPSEIHFLPENINNAAEYIEEYCPDLILKEWVSTDDDQYGRQLSEKSFEFMEKNKGLLEYEEDEFIKIQVDLKDYSNDQIESHISSYYKSISELREVYGDSADWIIAECIFEQESGLY
jgi:hypothetical protein